MNIPRKTGTTKWKYCGYAFAQRLRWRIAIALVAVGLLRMALPVLGEGTPANTTIRNRATGTFQDSDGNLTEVESNEVTLTVAEVAGITVQASGVTEADGDSQIAAGDLLFYQYTVTNVGNDPTRFRIPNSATVTGPGTVSGNLQISTDGGNSFIDIAGGEGFTGSIPADASILVRVPVTVTNAAAEGDEIAVQLGTTPGGAQNVERLDDATDVYTTDNPDGTGGGEVNGAPVNGTREASATQAITVASVPLALVNLLKTSATPVETNDPNDPSDDVITYQLGLEILSSIPPGSTGFVPDDLAGLTGTNLTIDGNFVNSILVSDAIASVVELTGNLSAPDGWQAIFTSDDPSTVAALDASWRTNADDVGGFGNVTRIGFIFNGTLPKGSSISGFEFEVVTSGVAETTAIANIAQVFGATEGNPNQLIFDESGDQNPNNFNDDGSFGSVDEEGNPIIGNGVGNPEADGIDSDNNNTGTGPGGEANLVVIEAPSGGISNGPRGNPDAVGPTSNSDDFTNVALSIPPDGNNPPPASFANTVENTTGADILVVPTAPEDPNSLPAGTTVTITFGDRSVTYTYDPATGFTTSDPPISIPGSLTSADYGISVQLPTAEPQTVYPISITAFVDENGDGQVSPDEPSNTTINRIYTGFVRMLKESRILPGTGPDVLPGQENFSADQKSPAPGNIIEYRFTYTNFSETGSDGNRTLSATNVLISEDGTTYDPVTNPSGNNWALDNDNSDGDSQTTTGIDTSNEVGSAVDSSGGVVEFFSGQPGTTPASDQSGTTTATDVSAYRVIVPTLEPGQSGTFTFRRRVN